MDIQNKYIKNILTIGAIALIGLFCTQITAGEKRLTGKHTPKSQQPRQTSTTETVRMLLRLEQEGKRNNLKKQAPVVFHLSSKTSPEARKLLKNMQSEHHPATESLSDTGFSDSANEFSKTFRGELPDQVIGAFQRQAEQIIKRRFSAPSSKCIIQ